MTTKKEDVIIRPAKKEDIRSILAVQKSLLLENNAHIDIEKKGFLVYPVDEEELKKMIKAVQNFLFVAESEGKIIGYALAYDLGDWRKNKLNWDNEIIASEEIKRHLSKGKIIYFRHIARMDEFSGIGNKLEEQVYKLAKSQGYKNVIGEILEKPVLNEKSKKVHEQRGYKKIGQVKYSDGKVWGLYEKELKPHR